MKDRLTGTRHKTLDGPLTWDGDVRLTDLCPPPGVGSSVFQVQDGIGGTRPVGRVGSTRVSTLPSAVGVTVEGSELPSSVPPVLGYPFVTHFVTLRVPVPVRYLRVCGDTA